jgi:cell division protein FtsL
MEDTVEVFADDAASLLTSATQQSIARKKKFQEEFARLKAEHQAEMEAHQKAQQEVQD